MLCPVRFFRFDLDHSDLVHLDLDHFDLDHLDLGHFDLDRFDLDQFSFRFENSHFVMRIRVSVENSHFI